MELWFLVSHQNANSESGSFGPCVANRSFPGYHWIYWVGPALGACISGGYFRFVKYCNYEEANPGQDATDEDEAASKAD